MHLISFCAISDLHGYLPQINKCDALLIAGDIVPLNIQRDNNKTKEWFTTTFAEWVKSLPCEKVIFIAGNHDFWMERILPVDLELIIIECGLQNKLVYLEDTMYTFNGATIYGCPWCTGPFGWAFSPCDTMPSVEEKYNQIPDCDILLCHQPPHVGTLGTSYPGTAWQRDFASDELLGKIVYRDINTVVCGHIHSGNHNGETLDNIKTIFYNVSIKDEDYNAAYKPLYFSMAKEE